MAIYQYNGKKAKIKRHDAGRYIMTAPGSERSVSIEFFSPATGATFTGWVARAEWRNDTYSDALNTYAEAKFIAAQMLFE